jgi:polar amino acid transport system substrate-binding protein
MSLSVMTPLRGMLCAIATMAFAPASAADLTAYSAEWPPYAFMKDGDVVGITTDLLRAACKEAKLGCAFVQLPWARAYLTARNVPNTLVYPTTRTPDREADFRWLGPMGPTLPGAAWVWRMKDREVNAASYRDLNRYHVGVVVGDSPVRELGLRGVSKDALDFANSNDINVRKFVSGRVDAIIDTDLGMAWQLKQQSRVPGDAMRCGASAAVFQRVARLFCRQPLHPGGNDRPAASGHPHRHSTWRYQGHYPPLSARRAIVVLWWICMVF